jgi:hypothetical protein
MTVTTTIPAPRTAPAVKDDLTPDAAGSVLPLEDLAPVLSGPQAQGDLIVLPLPDQTAPRLRGQYAVAAKHVPAAGIVLAVGSGGHAHTLLPDGPWVRVTPDRHGSERSLAVLFVPPGSTAVLAHDEHADLHLAPGAYLIRRQRQASPHPGPDAEVID